MLFCFGCIMGQKGQVRWWSSPSPHQRWKGFTHLVPQLKPPLIEGNKRAVTGPIQTESVLYPNRAGYDFLKGKGVNEQKLGPRMEPCVRSSDAAVPR